MQRVLGEYSFGEIGARYLKEACMADSTRSMRKAIFDRNIEPAWKNRRLSEITPDDLRQLCGKVKDRGAPATAIHDRVAGMAGSAAVRWSCGPCRSWTPPLDSDVRRHPARPQRADEGFHVEQLVCPQRDPMPVRAAVEHRQRRLALGGAGGVGQCRIHH